MFIIDKAVNKELIIKKSKFICLLFPINDTQDAVNIIDDIKNEHKTATHVCYAYITKNNQKCFDDKEPSGTAGLPILELLKKKELTNILAIVIRYYGGIKLGAGGLIRAYSNSVKEAINFATIKEYQEYITVYLEGKLNDIKNLDNLTKNYIVKNKVITSNIKYQLLVPKTDKNNITSTFHKYKIKIED